MSIPLHTLLNRKIHPLDVAFSSAIFAFSCWLMTWTFSYDPPSGSLVIASKFWSDFGAHLPLIRSFSYGSNWPPQSPLFPGEPIRYHFLFDAVSGLLERLGVRIDWAVNIPSILGFSAMLICLYAIGIRLFHNRKVGILAVVFALFNGSFSFLEFFRSHPLSPNTPIEILTNPTFPSFGPWDGKPVSAFWTLNIFTNQRHLAPSFAIIMAVILWLSHTDVSGVKTRIKRAIFTGLTVGLLFFLNQAAAAILVLWIGWIFIISRKDRLTMIIATVIALPIYILAHRLIAPSGAITFEPWYLVNQPITVGKVLWYWFANLGFHLILLPLGIAVAPKKARLFLSVPLLPLFIAPNVFRFSMDMINNHKFFNFFILICGLFSAQSLVWIWHADKKIGNRGIRFFTIFLLRVACIAGTGILTLSGLIDGAAVMNDYRMKLPDRDNPDIQAFRNLTPPGSVILNSTWLYHPANLAGRNIYSGYPYFTWSYGYDKEKRENVWWTLWRSPTAVDACTLLRKEKINYVEVADSPEQSVRTNRKMWESSFVRIYRNNETGLSLYDVAASCKNTANPMESYPVPVEKTGEKTPYL